MKKARLLAAAAAIAVGVTANFTVAAQIAPNWTDACDYPLNVPAELQDSVNRLLEAEVIITYKGNLHDLGNGYFSLPNRVDFLQYHNTSTGTTTDLCTQDSIFVDPTHPDVQLAQTGGNARSGFLIGPNVVATALHQDATLYPLQDMRVVFGWSRGGYHTSCSTDPSNLLIPASNIYTPVASVPGITTWDFWNSGLDSFAFSLDRNVMGHRYVRLRSSGFPSTDDTLAIAGHPFELGAKFEYGVTYAGQLGSYSNYDPTIPTFNNFHVDIGNSGSPIFNISKQVVEAVVRGPLTTLNTGDELDGYGMCGGAFYINGGRTLADLYDGVHHKPLPDALNFGKIEILSQGVPTREARFAPMQDAKYDVPLGGTLTQSQVYNVIGPTQSGVSVPVSVSVLPPPSGQPALLTNAFNLPYSGTLAHGDTQSFSVTASVPPNLSCGRYDRFLEVHEGEYTDKIRHSFEIGLVEVGVTPQDDWFVDDLGQPVSATRTYTVTNLRDAPANINVTGGGLPPIAIVLPSNGTNLSLGPKGSPTATATFTVGISQYVDTFTNLGQVYDAPIYINYLDHTCAASEGLVYHVKFKRGEQKFSNASGTQLVPPPTGKGYGTPVRFDIDLTGQGTYCVADANLDLAITSILGSPGRDTAPQFMKIQLTSPGGTTGTLWNGEVIPNDNYKVGEGIVGFGGDYTVLHLDDEFSPPLGPSLLHHFDGVAISGHWYIDVSSSASMPIAVGPIQIDLTRSTGLICHG